VRSARKLYSGGRPPQFASDSLPEAQAARRSSQCGWNKN